MEISHRQRVGKNDLSGNRVRRIRNVYHCTGHTGRRIETQILHFDKDTWRPYTYVWDDEQADAMLAPAEGLDRTFTVVDADAPGGRRNQTWHVAGQTECLLCHRTRGGLIYGFNPRQLNKDHAYEGVTDNQLRTLAHIGLFEKPAEEHPDPMPSPFDESVSL